MDSISIIIPTRNEPYIGTLVKKLRKIFGNVEIIVIEKGKELPKVDAKVVRQKTDGLANAFFEALKYTHGNIIADMDGDGSVSGDTQVMISDGNKIEIMPIEMFVNQFFKKGEEGFKPVKDYLTLAHSFKKSKSPRKGYLKLEGYAELKPFSGVYRHWVPDIYRVKYRGGMVDATGNHSVFVSKSNWSPDKKISIRVKRTFELIAGNRFRGDHIIPLNKTILRIPNIKSIKVYSKRDVKRNKAKYKKIPSRIRISKDLCRLFGYYVADGSIVHKKSLCFSFNRKEQDYIADVQKTMKHIFNLRGKIYDNGNEVNIYYYFLHIAKFFEKYFGKGVRGKKIPTFIFLSSRKHVVEFVRGWVNGDGYLSFSSKKVFISTVDYNLATQLVWLLACHGIISTISRKVTRERYIQEKKIKRTISYEIMIPKVSNLFLKRQNCLPVTKGLITSKKLKIHNDYVYDIVGSEGESFYGGMFPVLLHNSHRPEDLKKIVSEMKDADLAIGSRFVKGGRTLDKQHRQIISFATRKIFAFILGLKIEDMTAGFFAVRKEVLQKAKIKNVPGYKILFPLAYKAKQNNFRIKEVPITFVQRKGGKSHVSVFRISGIRELYYELKMAILLRIGLF